MIEILIQLSIFIVAIGVILYLFDLLRRFVAAQEKMAASLDSIARKLKDEAKP
jgi:hypothetical protein